MKKDAPGDDGAPLPANTWVMRIGKKTHLNHVALERCKALPGMFEFSSADKNSPRKRLSVWAEDLTIADQAWAIMGSKPDKTVVACLSVDAVREIASPEGFAGLDVEWERALNEDGSANEHPGAQGHCGICNLDQGKKADREKRHAIRSELADIATISPVPVPHDIAEEYIRLGAYFLYENDSDLDPSENDNWVESIRRLRRQRVRSHLENNAPVSPIDTEKSDSVRHDQ
jgi:hypothetical protein